MKGLMKKDFMMLKTQWIVMLGIFALISIFMIWMDASEGLISYITIYFLMQGVASIITDRMSRWNLYQTALPISRPTAIREKYILSLLCGLFGFGLSLAIVYGLGFGKDQEVVLINILLGWILSFSALGFGIPLITMLPKSAFILGIFGSLLPGGACVALWSIKLNEASAKAMATAGAAPFSMQTDFLWTCFAIMVLCVVLSYLIVPRLLAKMDQK